uniref:Uncharacterized protein n=1 Tax=Ursus americanus TaxID=9643 RepID=A0A452RWQ3_URSAM
WMAEITFRVPHSQPIALLPRGKHVPLMLKTPLPFFSSLRRTIRVWLKRDSGQYWPSIYHTMASPCSAMAYHHDSRRIFVGQDNGAVMVGSFQSVSKKEQ